MKRIDYICSSVNCPMKEDCLRYLYYIGKNSEKIYYNYEYTCNEFNGFPDYIHVNKIER